LADFVATLRDANIKCVLDIRAIPVSRKRGFSKSSLQAALADCGIEYMHIVTLGNPSRGRQAAKSGRFAEFRQIFEHHLRSGEARDGLRVAASRASEGGACLLCLERDPHQCHRLLVAEALELEHNFVVNHLTVAKPATDGTNGGSYGKSACTREGSAPAEPTAW
jgi:uncharacterized protein (DUF488 family)